MFRDTATRTSGRIYETYRLIEFSGRVTSIRTGTSWLTLLSLRLPIIFLPHRANDTCQQRDGCQRHNDSKHDESKRAMEIRTVSAITKDAV